MLAELLVTDISYLLSLYLSVLHALFLPREKDERSNNSDYTISAPRLFPAPVLISVFDVPDQLRFRARLWIDPIHVNTYLMTGVIIVFTFELTAVPVCKELIVIGAK